MTFVYRARSGPADPLHAGAGQRPALRAEVRHRRHAAGADRRGAGLLLQGQHAVFFDDRGRGGATRVQEPRLAKNTLLWERDGLLLRLEADQPAGELVRIARSRATDARATC